MSRRKKAFFGAVAAVAAVLFLEALLRITGAVRVFEPFSCEGGPGEKSCSFNFNPAVPPFRSPKPQGKTRIVVIGESAVNGYPFEGAGFPEMLGTMLGPDRAEVIKLAANGVNTSFLREVLRDGLPLLQPDVVVIYAGNNELMGKDAVDDLAHPAWGRLHWRLRRGCRLWNLPMNMIGAFFSRGAAVALLSRITHQQEKPGRWMNPPEEKERVNALYIHHLSQMIVLSRQYAAAPVLCVPGVNLRDWVPMKSTPAAMPSPEIERARGLLAGGQPSNALPLLRQAAADDPSYARARFFYGRALLALGRAGEARAEFEAAADNADFYQEVPPHTAALVRELAAREKTVLIDVARALDDKSEGGAAGFNYFFDGCHLNLEGNHLAASLILEKLVELDLTGDRVPDPEDLQTVIRRLKLKPKGLGLAMFNQALVLAFLYPPPEYRVPAFQILERSKQFGMNPALADLYQAVAMASLGNAEKAAECFTASRTADQTVFFAAIGTKLPAAVMAEGDILYFKNPPPKDMPLLYPGDSGQDSLPRPGPDNFSLRFKWNGTRYSP